MIIIDMVQDQSVIRKILRWFNLAGLIHTLISISILVLSILNILHDEYHKMIQTLSLVTIVNSAIWVILGLILLVFANSLDSGHSTFYNRLVLFIAIWLVLTPDIVTTTIFYLPQLKEAKFINFIAMVSPILVFIGWIIGKHLGKKSK